MFGDRELDRQITLLCPVCGHDQFEHDEASHEAPVRCADCSAEFDRESLIGENGTIIEAAVDELKDEVAHKVRAEFRKIFRNMKGWTLK